MKLGVCSMMLECYKFVFGVLDAINESSPIGLLGQLTGSGIQDLLMFTAYQTSVSVF